MNYFFSGLFIQSFLETFDILDICLCGNILYSIIFFLPRLPKWGVLNMYNCILSVIFLTRWNFLNVKKEDYFVSYWQYKHAGYTIITLLSVALIPRIKRSMNFSTMAHIFPNNILLNSVSKDWELWWLRLAYNRKVFLF